VLIYWLHGARAMYHIIIMKMLCLGNRRRRGERDTVYIAVNRHGHSNSAHAAPMVDLYINIHRILYYVYLRRITDLLRFKGVHYPYLCIYIYDVYISVSKRVYSIYTSRTIYYICLMYIVHVHIHLPKLQTNAWSCVIVTCFV